MAFLRRTRTILAAAGLLALAIGCGESVPVGMDTTVPDPTTIPALGKKTTSGEAPTTVTKEIVDKKGGNLKLEFKKPSDKSIVAVTLAKLKIPKKALGKTGARHTISMTVTSGTELNDIVVAFTPAGLEFVPDALLVLEIVGPVSAEDIESAQHLYGDGYVESVEVTAKDKGKKTRVKIVVPGFSRYGFDDDGAMSEESEL